MTQVKNRGWSVTFAGLGINLALGILYTWSIFKLAIRDSIMAGDGRFNWDLASLNDPYAVCCLVFAISMIPAGRLQDKLSPRVTAIIGGVLTGLGLIIISQSTSLMSWILGFGVFAGMGIGFAYASATPPAIKWFPSSKTGMIAGIVVAGFGLASVYIAPLSNYLISTVGLSAAMMVFGVAFLILVSGLAMFLINPPVGFIPENADAQMQKTAIKSAPVKNYQPSEMLKTGAFVRLWLMYFVAAGAGLFIIGGVAVMAKQSMGHLAWVVVALLAVGNAGGRVVAGILSDKIGRSLTLSIMLGLQSIIIFSLLFIDQNVALLVVFAATFIGFNYGTNLSLFPSFTKDYFGMKNFGINYGIVFSAWGIGGFIFPRMAQMIVAKTGTYTIAYIVTAGLLVLGSFLALTAKAPSEATEAKDILVTVKSEPGLAR